MTGVPIGPGPGKSPKDRNEFPLGPYRIDVERDVPQVRQKAERAERAINTLAFTDAYAVAGTEQGVAMYTAEVVTYDVPSATGTANLEGSSVDFKNVTKLTAAAGDIIIVAKLTDGSYIMMGRLSQAGDTIGGSFPSGALPTGYPFDTTAGSYDLYRHGSMNSGNTEFIIDRAGQLGFGLETVISNPNASGNITLNGFVLSTGGNFTLGSPPAPLSGSRTFGHADGYIIVGGVTGGFYQTVIWNPSSGWGTVVSTGLPDGNLYVDSEAERVWIIVREATTNFPRIYSFFNGVLVDNGRMGLPNEVVTFVAASNGYIVVRSNTSGRMYSKTTTGLDNFSGRAICALPTGVARRVSADGTYVASVQPGTGVFPDFYLLNLFNGTEIAFPDILPVDCYPHAIVEGLNGGYIFICAEKTTNFPDGSSYPATSACAAIYGFDGSFTYEIWHNVTLRAEGVSWVQSAQILTKVLGASRMDGDTFCFYPYSLTLSGPDYGYFLRFVNV